jgi:hypothetical protein
MWAAGSAVSVICAAVDMTRDAFIARRLDQLADLPIRARGCRAGIPRMPEPTEKEFPPEMIAQRAAEIRAGWTESERLKRLSVGRVPPTTHRVVSRADVAAAIRNR